MKLALISEVFYHPEDLEELDECLAEAKARGAELALLPELPLNPWAPATREVRAEDAEELGGRRYQMLQAAARKNEIGLVGGAIVSDSSGRRRNTALVFDAGGILQGSYAKVHLPEEEGFWETSHYEPGENPPQVFSQFTIPFGVQICSDNNRPQGSHYLASQGAGLILVPRASEKATYERWRLVFRANALTCACFVASVNRPRPEQDVLIGGPSILVGPDGDVLLETTDRVAVGNLAPERLPKARKAYPGYLAWPASFYARCWEGVK